MEKYVLLRGKVTGRWYDFDKRAHYHIIVTAEEEGKMKEYDVAVNIGSIQEKNSEVYSSNLQVYYDRDYSFNQKILKEMLLQNKGITKARKNLNLDYVKMKLFPHEKMRHMKGVDKENIFLTGIIEKHILESIDSDIHEVFAFGNLYENKKGIHDIHMNQGSRGRHSNGDAAYSDGGLFFYNNSTEKWAAIFIAFISQSLKTDKRGKAINELPEI